MALTFKVDTDIQSKIDVTKGEQFYVGTITPSGSYTAGGDTLSFAVPNIMSNAAPIRVEVYEEPTTSQTPVGDIFIYLKGTTSANGKVFIYVPTTGAASGDSALAQFSGAYGTVFSNTTIKARAWFPLGQ